MIGTGLKNLPFVGLYFPSSSFSCKVNVVMWLLFFYFFLLGGSEFSGQFSERLSDGGFTSPNGLMGLVFLLVEKSVICHYIKMTCIPLQN